MFQDSFQWVSRVFERSSKEIQGKFQICLKGVPKKILGCFNKEVSECFKKVSRAFQETLEGVF